MSPGDDEDSYYCGYGHLNRKLWCKLLVFVLIHVQTPPRRKIDQGSEIMLKVQKSVYRSEDE